MKRTARGVVCAILVVHFLVFVASLRAQDSASAAGSPPPPRSVNAEPLTGEIRLDGKLDEPAWRTAQPATDLYQWEPHEGQLATQRTEVRFLFDADAIYIGARMYDELGAAGVQSRLVRGSRGMSGARFAIQAARWTIQPPQWSVRVNNLPRCLLLR